MYNIMTKFWDNNKLIVNFLFPLCAMLCKGMNCSLCLSCLWVGGEPRPRSRFGCDRRSSYSTKCAVQYFYQLLQYKNVKFIICIGSYMTNFAIQYFFSSYSTKCAVQHFYQLLLYKMCSTTFLSAPTVQKCEVHDLYQLLQYKFCSITFFQPLQYKKCEVHHLHQLLQFKMSSSG